LDNGSQNTVRQEEWVLLLSSKQAMMTTMIYYAFYKELEERSWKVPNSMVFMKMEMLIILIW
jgi:hypothetical protein